MAFFSARCRLIMMLSLSRQQSRAVEKAVKIDMSSANFTAKSHFQMSTFKMSP